MTEEEHNKIEDIILRYDNDEITKDQLYSEIGGIDNFVDKIIQDKDADAVSSLALDIICRIINEDPSEENHLIIFLHKFVLESWHYSYEEIAHILQDLKNPLSVPIIKEAMQKKYDFLESYETGTRQFINQCGHALKSIGTVEALAVIKELSVSNDPILKDEMLYRLSRIEMKNDYERNYDL